MLEDGRIDPPRSADRPSLRVVEAVADADGVDPIDVEPPLNDAIDATALDRLFESTGRATPRSGRVSFSYRGYDVTVHADGRVELE